MSLIIPDKDVLLSISGTHTPWGEEPEVVELTTAGKLITLANGFDVIYEESELTGLDGTRTTVKLDGKNVTMIRTGTYPSEMLFSENQRHVGLYHTVGGAMTISTHTSKVDNRIGEEGGSLVIDYSIEIDNNFAGEHHFEMTVATSPMEC